MRLTPALLRQAMGCTTAAAARYAEPLAAACAFYGVDTPTRLADFLAQIGHESGSLRYSGELWGPTAQQRRYERDFDSPWPTSKAESKLPAFERNRLAYVLGNVERGDGELFKGHGPIQTTGRRNHARVRDRLRERFPNVPDFEAEPEALTDPQWGALATADYWDDNELNVLSDADDFERMTRKINGGLNGYSDRLARRARARSALLGVDATGASSPPANQQPAPVQPLTATAHTKEPTMAPFIAAGITALIQAAPALIRVFGDSPRAEKNAQAAEVVADLAKQVTGESTVEGAVNAIQADPAQAAAFREQVHLSMNELVGLAERIVAMERIDIQAARQYNSEEPLFLDFGWLRLKFIHFLSVGFVAFSGAFVWRFFEQLTPELKGAVITLMVIAGYVGVKDYWMSSSAGSASKNEMLKNRGSAPPQP